MRRWVSRWVDRSVGRSVSWSFGGKVGRLVATDIYHKITASRDCPQGSYFHQAIPKDIPAQFA